VLAPQSLDRINQTIYLYLNKRQQLKLVQEKTAACCRLETFLDLPHKENQIIKITPK